MTLALRPVYGRDEATSVISENNHFSGTEVDVTDNVKRIVMAPSSAGPLRAGELLSVDLGADEDVQWIWCHHGERGTSVIGYTIASPEPIEIPEERPIGFFSLEEKR